MMNIKTLSDLLVNSAESYGDKTYIKERKGKDVLEYSFKKLYDDCMKLVSFYNKISSSSIHCAVIGTTSYNYLLAYFGTVSAGNVIVPLDAQLPTDDISDHLIRADVEVFFYDKNHSGIIDEIKKQCPDIHTYIALDEIQSVIENLPISEPIEIDPEKCASIVYTSGTTGKSKGVMLSHRNLIDNTMCCDNESSVEDSLLSVLPIHHVYCLTCDILLSMRYGATVCVNDSLMHISRNLQFFKPTIILLVPMIAETIYKKMRAFADSNPEISMNDIAKSTFGGRLKVIYSGGAYLNPELAEAYNSFGIVIAQGYGMTECSPRISTASINEPNKEDVGKIVPGCEVKIVDGEIWAKSPSVMMGYYKNPDATKEALTDDGWLRTGDLGYVDDRNHLYITGRKKNLIILSNGENVSPEEIENKFAGIDFVSEVLVYAEDGLITAEVFPNQEYTAKNPDSDIKNLVCDFIQKINEKLPSAKIVRRIRLRTVEFDKTASKKIKREQSEKGEVIY